MYKMINFNWSSDQTSCEALITRKNTRSGAIPFSAPTNITMNRDYGCLVNNKTKNQTNDQSADDPFD